MRGIARDCLVDALADQQRLGASRAVRRGRRRPKNDRRLAAISAIVETEHDAHVGQGPIEGLFALLLTCHVRSVWHGQNHRSQDLMAPQIICAMNVAPHRHKKIFQRQPADIALRIGKFDIRAECDRGIAALDGWTMAQGRLSKMAW